MIEDYKSRVEEAMILFISRIKYPFLTHAEKARGGRDLMRPDSLLYIYL